jgi:enoyl-CoA hydratase
LTVNRLTMEYQILKIQIADRIAVVTISRPAALNALNTNFFKELNHFIDDLEPREDIKALVITGEGKSFVAGADIAEMANMNSDEGYAFSTFGQRTFDRLEQLRIPVIAAVNGYALGGGCELAMACDFRVASRSAKFGQPEMNLGMIPGYAATQRLSRLTGLGNALFLILTAETISAEDALRIGLVQKVTEPEALMEEVMKLASKIANNGSQALPVSKRIIRKGITMDFQEASELEAAEFGKQFDRDTTKEGMKAFLEKRKPDW